MAQLNERLCRLMDLGRSEFRADEENSFNDSFEYLTNYRVLYGDEVKHGVPIFERFEGDIFNRREMIFVGGERELGITKTYEVHYMVMPYFLKCGSLPLKQRMSQLRLHNHSKLYLAGNHPRELVSSVHVAREKHPAVRIEFSSEEGNQ